MSNPELRIVDVRDDNIGQVNTQALMENSGLAADDMESHPRALFLVEQAASGALALGYVACVDIKYDQSRSNPNANGQQALISRLFVMPEHRRRGHATDMVKRLTDTLFEDRLIVACLANCYPDVGAVFEKAGFEPGESRNKQRIAYRLTREAWQTDKR